MKMINNVTLVGRLTKNPSIKYTSNGKAVATVTLAVQRNFANEDGTKEADFIQCIAWGKRAETLANYVEKGSMLGIVGRIQTSNYDNDEGKRVYLTEIVVSEFQFLDKKNNIKVDNDKSYPQAKNNSNLIDGTSIDIKDTDLPF